MMPLSKTVHADLVAVLTGIKGANKRRIEFADALSECLRITESRRTKIETMGGKTMDQTLSNEAMRLIAAKAREQPVPEIHAIEIDLLTGEVQATVIVLN